MKIEIDLEKTLAHLGGVSAENVEWMNRELSMRCGLFGRSLAEQIGEAYEAATSSTCVVDGDGEIWVEVEPGAFALEGAFEGRGRTRSLDSIEECYGIDDGSGRSVWTDGDVVQVVANPSLVWVRGTDAWLAAADGVVDRNLERGFYRLLRRQADEW